MGKNQARLKESKLGPEAAAKAVKAGLFHTSDKENRESIETKGLLASKPWDDEPKGVYLHVGQPYPARQDPGQDVYQVTPQSSRTPIHRDTGEEGNVFIPKTVPISDFKRVGHFYRNTSGHPEIHWHTEESCPNNK
jgi:hypothetical protein